MYGFRRPARFPHRTHRRQDDEKAFLRFQTSSHKMTTLHIFNPSHDEALASGSPYYTPARAARRLATDLSALPAWRAADGDTVLLDEATPAVPEGPVRRGVRFARRKDLSAEFWKRIGRIAPWGWDARLVHGLRRLGAPERLLPSASELEAIRRLSARSTAVRLLEAVRTDVPATAGTSRWCTDETETWRTVEQYGAAMLKAPWSSSGRGVFRADTTPDEGTRRRVARILLTQGGIEVEPFYRKTADLAMEFVATDYGVRTEGLSLFRTTATGGYTGNVVADERTLRDSIGQAFLPVLDDVCRSLCRHLAVIADGYRGPMGVDMMTVRTDDGDMALHPCVELNLRDTMGRVALSLRPLLPAGTQGTFRLRSVRPDNAPARCLTPGAGHVEAVLEAAAVHPGI